MVSRPILLGARSVRLGALVALTLTLVCRVAAQSEVSPAASDVPAEADAARAKRLFEDGLAELRAQSWLEAESRFRESLALVPRSSTEYDLAFVLYKQSKLRESAERLRRLLDAERYSDDARYVAYARSLLAVVTSAQAETAPARAPHAQVAPRAALAASQPSSPLSAIGPWVAIGVGAALLAGSAISGLMAQHADADFSHACPTHRDCDPSLRPARDRIATLGLTSDVLLASGAALSAGGLSWRLIVDTTPNEPGRASALLMATLRE